MWDTPHVAHDNPSDQHYHASLILGFPDTAARKAFFGSSEINGISVLLAPSSTGFSSSSKPSPVARPATSWSSGCPSTGYWWHKTSCTTRCICSSGTTTSTAGRQILEKLADPAYDTILPGHGLPAGPAVLAENAEYLRTARELLGDDGQAYKQAIIEGFPDYGIPFVIDIGNYYLFGTRPA